MGIPIVGQTLSQWGDAIDAWTVWITYTCFKMSWYVLYQHPRWNQVLYECVSQAIWSSMRGYNIYNYIYMYILLVCVCVNMFDCLKGLDDWTVRYLLTISNDMLDMCISIADKEQIRTASICFLLFSHLSRSTSCFGERAAPVDWLVPQHSGFLQHQFNLRVQAKSADVHVPLLESWITECSRKKSMAIVKSKLVSESCLWSAYMPCFFPCIHLVRNPMSRLIVFLELTSLTTDWCQDPVVLCCYSDIDMFVMSRTSLLTVLSMRLDSLPRDNANKLGHEISGSHGTPLV